MFSHAHGAVFGDHLVLVTTARWRTHACCKITVSQPWRKYSCVAFFEAAGAKFCDNATAWTALIPILQYSLTRVWSHVGRPATGYVMQMAPESVIIVHLVTSGMNCILMVE